MKKRLFAMATALGAMASPALATSEWYEVSAISVAPVTTVAGVVVTAIAGIWAVKKVIKLLNRS